MSSIPIALVRASDLISIVDASSVSSGILTSKSTVVKERSGIAALNFGRAFPDISSGCRIRWCEEQQHLHFMAGFTKLGKQKVPQFGVELPVEISKMVVEEDEEVA